MQEDERPEVIEIMQRYGHMVIERAAYGDVTADEIVDRFCAVMKIIVIPALLSGHVTKH